MRKLLVFFILAMVAMGSRAENSGPFVSGDVTRYSQGDQARKSLLVEPQLLAIASSLEHWKNGWGPQIAENSNEPVEAQLHLVRSDGQYLDMAIVKRRNGGSYLRVSRGPGEIWAYESWLLHSTVALHELDETEHRALLDVLLKPDSQESAN